jgi:hypothetical protein
METNKKVVIVRGISGSGKSHYASSLAATGVVSADNFFVGEDGVYRFDPSKLPLAHAECMLQFIELMREPPTHRLVQFTELMREPRTHRLVVVDNTNTTVAEIAPYMAVAAAYGWHAEIHHVHCDVRVAAARNRHGVPLAGCEAQARRIAESVLPPWWAVKVID